MYNQRHNVRLRVTYFEYDPVDGYRRCMRCKQDKPMNNFAYHRSMPDLKHYYCKQCMKELITIRREAIRLSALARKQEPKPRLAKPSVELSPEARLVQRQHYLKKKYGLDHAEYERMLLSQNGACAICKSTEPGSNRKSFAVDHDHETGGVRGLLCNKCNIGLGYLDDDADRLVVASEYLRKWEKVHEESRQSGYKPTAALESQSSR